MLADLQRCFELEVMALLRGVVELIFPGINFVLDCVTDTSFLWLFQMKSLLIYFLRIS